MIVGDEAKIYYNGNKYVYRIKEIIVVEPTDTSVLAQTDTPTLTLMTCTPPGTNWKRLIVKFDQIAPEYKAPVIVEKKQPVTVTSLPNSDSNGLLDFIAKIFRF
jgi:sortase (surface protein transpeptidase)